MKDVYVAYFNLKGMFGALNMNYNKNNNFLLLKIKCVVIELLNLFISLVVSCNARIKFMIYIKKYLIHTIIFHKK